MRMNRFNFVRSKQGGNAASECRNDFRFSFHHRCDFYRYTIDIDAVQLVGMGNLVEFLG